MAASWWRVKRNPRLDTSPPPRHATPPRGQHSEEVWEDPFGGALYSPAHARCEAAARMARDRHRPAGAAGWRFRAVAANPRLGPRPGDERNAHWPGPWRCSRASSRAGSRRTSVVATRPIRAGSPRDSWQIRGAGPALDAPAGSRRKTPSMLTTVATRLRSTRTLIGIWIGRWTRPTTRPLLGYLLDRGRSHEDLVRENALLRKQLEIACRQLRRPTLRRVDRVTLVLLARLASTRARPCCWSSPTPSCAGTGRASSFSGAGSRSGAAAAPRIAAATVALIQRMAHDNALWGAERIRGELLKLGIRVAKGTIQKHLRRAVPLARRGHPGRPSCVPRPGDLGLRLPAGLRPVLPSPVRVLRHRARLPPRRAQRRDPTPSSAWVTQQLREATAWGEGPRFLIRDNDDKFGRQFDALARARGDPILRTPVRAPNANAVCERFLRSVRAECLDHLIILGEASLASILRLLQLLQQRAAASRHPSAGPRRSTDSGRRPSWRSPCSVVSTTSIGGPRRRG